MYKVIFFLYSIFDCIMEWSFGQDRMLSLLEVRDQPTRTIQYYCCCFQRRDITIKN